MINLLAYDKKREIRAGKFNVMSLKFLVISLAGVGLIALLLGLSFIVLTTARDGAVKRAEENATTIGGYSADKQEIQEYASKLSTIATILDSQVYYSKIFLAIGSALPNDAIIRELSVKPDNFTTGLQLTVYSRTKESMVKVKDNMQKVPDIFSNVQFSSVNFEDCEDRPDLPLENTPYSCEATLQVTFNEKVKGSKE